MKEEIPVNAFASSRKNLRRRIPASAAVESRGNAFYKYDRHRTQVR